MSSSSYNLSEMFLLIDESENFNMLIFFYLTKCQLYIIQNNP